MLGTQVTPEKRKKIKALLDNPASTENEKEICRKLLKDNPEDMGEPVKASDVLRRFNAQKRAAGFWNQAQAAGAAQDAARQQQQAAWGNRNQRPYHCRPYNEAEDRAQEGAERNRDRQRQTSFEEFKNRLFAGDEIRFSHNDFLDNLARKMAEDIKKGKKDE